jgi:hypothetical protein
MAVDYASGSIATEFKTATIYHPTLFGSDSFSQELTDMISGGYVLDGMFVSGSMNVAFLHQKK